MWLPHTLHSEQTLEAFQCQVDPLSIHTWVHGNENLHHKPNSNQVITSLDIPQFYTRAELHLSSKAMLMFHSSLLPHSIKFSDCKSANLQISCASTDRILTKELISILPQSQAFRVWQKRLARTRILFEPIYKILHLGWNSIEVRGQETWDSKRPFMDPS